MASSSIHMSRCACRAKPAALSANNYRSASIKALSAKACGASRRSRGVYYFSVQANELNKWAGRSMDDHCEPNRFDEETAGVLLRVITARAVKLLLTQLQELDMLQAQWFNNYCAENPPTEGDKFIADLFNAKGVVVFDPNTQHNHHIDPQNLAHRLLQVRGDMASNVTLDLPNFVKRRNTGVLRTHLERNTFVSGSNDDGYKERRGYIRPARK